MSYDTITKLFITKITILYIHLMDMDWRFAMRTLIFHQIFVLRNVSHTASAIVSKAILIRDTLNYEVLHYFFVEEIKTMFLQDLFVSIWKLHNKGDNKISNFVEFNCVSPFSYISSCDN
jgi:hypothetical protein